MSRPVEARKTKWLTPACQPLSLLLKLSPLVDELVLYDVVNTPGVATDLSHISSNAVSRTGKVGAARQAYGPLMAVIVRRK